MGSHILDAAAFVVMSGWYGETKVQKAKSFYVVMLWMPRLPYNWIIFIKIQKFKNDFL
nr:unnamed protein product [Callosobruchus analis]